MDGKSLASFYLGLSLFLSLLKKYLTNGSLAW